MKLEKGHRRRMALKEERGGCEVMRVSSRLEGHTTI